MSEKKQGAAEWLRGIVDGYEADGDIGCSDMAKRFGNECSRMGSCRNCMIKMMTAIAYRIDLDMVGYERLKKENAELREMLERWQNYHLNMIARAKKLAGIEEEARND